MTCSRSRCAVLIAVFAVATLIPSCIASICPFPIDPAPIGPSNPFPDIGEIRDPCPFPIDPAPLADPCPFPDSGEVVGQISDPAGNTGSSVEGTGSQVDPSPPINSSISGCPFSPPPTPEPVIWAFPADLSNPASAGAPPIDIDKDGKYEDINGNGQLEFEDVILLFKDLSWCANHQPVSPFDFDKDGKIGFHDVLELFIKAGRQ